MSSEEIFRSHNFLHKIQSTPFSFFDLLISNRILTIFLLIMICFAKSGFGGEQNDETTKINDKNSEVDVLKKDTNKLMSDTTGLKDNLNESLKKAESEMSKVDLNVMTKEINLDKDTGEIKSAIKDASKITIQTLDGKTYKSGDKGFKGELKKAQGAVKKSMNNITKDSGKFISNIKKADITKSITKEKKIKNYRC